MCSGRPADNDWFTDALSRMITAHQLRDPGMVEFWQGMSTKLFANVKELFDQIDTQYKERTGDEGMGGQMAVSKSHISTAHNTFWILTSTKGILHLQLRLPNLLPVQISNV